jgi:hypothetical protein
MPNSKPRLETTICKNIQRQLLAIPGCYVEKRHGGTYTTAGRPDLSGCYYGRRFEIEVKRPGGTLTNLQFAELVAWKQVGAICGVATSEIDTICILLSDPESTVILCSHGIIMPEKAVAYRDKSLHTVGWEKFKAPIGLTAAQYLKLHQEFVNGIANITKERTP